MSLKQIEMSEVPADTAKIAKKAFRKGNPYMVLREKLGSLYTNAHYREMFSHTGKPGHAPGLLALVTAVQFMEDLTDREVADAVRARIDLKYLLGLALDDEGFDYSVLSEFRSRLVEHQKVERLLDDLLQVCVEHGLLKEGGKQRTDATHVLSAVRNVNRYELVGESMRQVLNGIAVVAPTWLQSRVPVYWYERYVHRIELFRLPKGDAPRVRWAEEVGKDGQLLLAWLEAEDAPAYLREIPAVGILRQVWQQQYDLTKGQVRWRRAGELPRGSEMIQSPYDPEARYSQKGSALDWKGYKAFFTESCDEENPPLVTCVMTTPASESDFNLVAPIHEHLQARNLLPSQHIVDSGFMSADNYRQSHDDFKVDLVGPALADASWQSLAQSGFAHADFHIDWETQRVTCPGGHQSKSWSPETKRDSILVRFDRKTCAACPLRSACTRSAEGPRNLRFRMPDAYFALQQARLRLHDPEFRQLYPNRAGIEGTFSFALRMAGLRRSRYIGLLKTHLQHIFIAIAINLLRIAYFFLDRKHKLYVNPFAALAPTGNALFSSSS